MSPGSAGVLAVVSVMGSGLACSAKSAAPADAGATQVTGAVGGMSFAAQDAVFTSARAKGLGFSGASTVVLIADFGGVCAHESANAGVKGGRSLFLGLAMNDAAGAAAPVSGSGVFVVGPGSEAQMTGARAQLFYQRYGADCLRTESHAALSGQVTLTEVAASTLEGSFDIVLADTSEHVTGSFVAASCAAFDPNRTPKASCM